MRIDSEQRIKFVPQRRKQTLIPHAVDLNDPASFRPLAMGTHAALLWPYATMQGWMVKLMPPAFSFSKSRQRRYVVLVDRMIYTFKTDSPQQDFREFFELTSNTNIFVTDQFPGKLYCIELQRNDDGRTWYLQAENVEDLKQWLDKLKRTTQWLHTAPADTPQVPPSPTFIIRSNKDRSPGYMSPSPKIGTCSFVRRPSQLPDVLPPQLPPPTSRPPPPPTLMR
ncbi:hypothetical protein BX666DRAFT_2156460 [Dichotomocladium elegans]|nr:hypothetical protein BX666DRAFT_2156460 [Dichotomocladium elegans]